MSLHTCPEARPWAKPIAEEVKECTCRPGEYIVRALVGIEGQALTGVIRTLKKSAR